MTYRIGEFSLITRLPVKTLRYYHEMGLLVPARVDQFTGYRRYAPEQAARARLIRQLRMLEFPLESIRAALEKLDAGQPIDEVVAEQQRAVRERLRELHALEGRLAALAARGPRAGGVTRKRIESELVACVKFTGDYPEVGSRFRRLFGAVGAHASGFPTALYWEAEYLPGEARIWVCIPTARVITAEGIECEIVQGGEVLSTVHRGPYEGLGDAYERLFAAAGRDGRPVGVPIRERYLSGPGDPEAPEPDDFLTEVVISVVGEAAAPR